MRLETALEQFMRKVDIIVSLEIGGKLSAEAAYQNIKQEVKELKRLRKNERATTANAYTDVNRLRK